ncbi:SHOCT domain-containing protein [Cellulosimicrobium cellulans]|uniref:SHOCT domain-containing protein n=1 Tax=Cellulosimicrobium cellulans TaxID=1710 RepID=UPI001EDC48A0|nr:SHOCT domain-containing protein [Cellulosimicrobium cellulans]UKJ63167.1 SHOCT domain-containing protein [Cellulosimicrobium cellulans]
MPGLLRGVARTAVVAGTATAVSNRVSRRQAGRWAAQEAAQEPQYAPPPQQYAAPQPTYSPPPAPPAAAPDMDARIAQLTQLGALRDQGVLSPEEFEAQKARILAG